MEKKKEFREFREAETAAGRPAPPTQIVVNEELNKEEINKLVDAIKNKANLLPRRIQEVKKKSVHFGKWLLELDDQ